MSVVAETAIETDKMKKFDPLFSHKNDDWETPLGFFAKLHEEFHFVVDVAASSANRKCERYFGPDHPHPPFRDARRADQRWGLRGETVWCNPPYSMCKDFVAKASQEAAEGITTVMLVPARTDTMWFHQWVWDKRGNHPRTGVEVRFLQGRLKFTRNGEELTSAPFPSMVVVFHGAV